MGKQAGKSRAGRKGSQTGSLHLWVAFLTWESVWEGPGWGTQHWLLGPSCPQCLILEPQGADGSGFRGTAHPGPGVCFAPLLCTWAGLSCQTPGHSWPALRQLHNIPLGHRAPSRTCHPSEVPPWPFPAQPDWCSQDGSTGGGGIASPTEGLTPHLPSWKAEGAGRTVQVEHGAVLENSPVLGMLELELRPVPGRQQRCTHTGPRALGKLCLLHRITAHPEHEGTHMDHPVQPLTLSRTHQQPLPVPESMVQTLLQLWQPWGHDHSLGSPFHIPVTLWGGNLFLISDLSLPWHSFMLFLWVLWLCHLHTGENFSPSTTGLWILAATQGQTPPGMIPLDFT